MCIDASWVATRHGGRIVPCGGTPDTQRRRKPRHTRPDWSRRSRSVRVDTGGFGMPGPERTPTTRCDQAGSTRLSGARCPATTGNAITSEASTKRAGGRRRTAAQGQPTARVGRTLGSASASSVSRTTEMNLPPAPQIGSNAGSTTFVTNQHDHRDNYSSQEDYHSQGLEVVG